MEPARYEWDNLTVNANINVQHWNVIFKKKPRKLSNIRLR